MIAGVASRNFEIQGTGNLHPPLSQIEVLYILTFPTSIISFEDIRRHFKIKYVNIKEVNLDSIQIYSDNAHIANFSKTPNGLFAYSHELYLTIVQNLQLKGTEKDSIKFMSRAHNLHMLTAYTDLDRLATALRNNSISGTPKDGVVTDRDVENYKRHMHASVCNGCRFGKSSGAPAPQLDNVDTCHDIGTLFADIFHINLDNDRLNFFIAMMEHLK